jgi:hypothetical protein
MQRHPTDPVSAALGLLAVALGVLVAAGALDGFDDHGGWWLAIAAVIVGVAIVPWRWRAAQDGSSAPEEVGE